MFAHSFIRLQRFKKNSSLAKQAASRAAPSSSRECAYSSCLHRAQLLRASRPHRRQHRMKRCLEQHAHARFVPIPLASQRDLSLFPSTGGVERGVRQRAACA
eukprot:3959955-Pleurochrysis_carterae.AAC.2